MAKFLTAGEGVTLPDTLSAYRRPARARVYVHNRPNCQKVSQRHSGGISTPTVVEIGKPE